MMHGAGPCACMAPGTGYCDASPRAAHDALLRCAANGGPVSEDAARRLSALGLRVEYSAALGPWLNACEPNDAVLASITLLSMQQRIRYAAAILRPRRHCPFYTYGCTRPHHETGIFLARKTCPIHGRDP